MAPECPELRRGVLRWPYGQPEYGCQRRHYGTTFNIPSAGAIFKLTPSNGGWSETNLYSFGNGLDGGHPDSNVLFDANGNLYGGISRR